MRLSNKELFINLLALTLLSYIVAFTTQDILIKIISVLGGMFISIYETIMFFQRGRF